MHPTLEKYVTPDATPALFRIDYVWLRVGADRISLTRVDAYACAPGSPDVELIVSGRPRVLQMGDARHAKALVEALDAHFHRVGESIEHAKERRSERR